MSNTVQKTRSISSILSEIGGIILLLLFVMLGLTVAILVLGVGATFVGRIIGQVSGLTPFEGTVIAVTIGIASVYFLSDKTRPHYPWESLTSDSDDEDEDEDEWDEDENPSPDFHVPATPVRRVQPPPNPNDRCPCGSGKKYKNCHGR